MTQKQFHHRRVKTARVPEKCRHFTLLELIFALGLLVLLATCFADSLELVRRQDRWFTEENRALLILDNTLERLTARPVRTLEEAQAIFLDEFRQSGLSANPELSPVCNLNQRRLVLEILKQNRKPLAHLEFTCKSE